MLMSLIATGCGGDKQPVAPTPVPMPVMLEFAALNGPPEYITSTLTEQGFAVTPSPQWYNASFGRTGPSISLYRFQTLPTIEGTLTITATDGSLFTFTSLEAGPSQTMPYGFKGLKGGQVVMESANTSPRFGPEVMGLIANPSPTVAMDTLVIRITTTRAECCATQTYIDNIALMKLAK